MTFGLEEKMAKRTTYRPDGYAAGKNCETVNRLSGDSDHKSKGPALPPPQLPRTRGFGFKCFYSTFSLI